MKLQEIFEDRVDPDDIVSVECRKCGSIQNMMHGDDPADKECDDCGGPMAHPDDLDNEQEQK